MNKAELIQEVANQTGLTKRTSRKAIDAITSVIADSLSRQERVTLVGFGTFQVMERKGRRGKNPQTRKAINIPAKRVPKFRPGKSFEGEGEVDLPPLIVPLSKLGLTGKSIEQEVVDN